MKKTLLAGLAVMALGTMALTPAEASGGCGPNAFRDDYGACRWKPRAPRYNPAFGPGPGWGWHRPHHHRGWDGGYGGYGGRRW